MTERKEVNIWELSDLCTPWCVHVAATLGIANLIAGGVETIEDLAKATGSERDALHAVLGHLVSKGVFEEPSPGRFALNQAARGLLDPMTQATLDLEGLGGRFAGAWGTLLQYVRSGAAGYAQVFGRPFFEDLAAHPRLSADFDALIGPAGHGAPNPEFELTCGWESIRTVVDVGGGTGAMLAEILRARPHLRGILVDQPQTVERSAEIFRAAGVAERVTTVGQSFFDPLPQGADLYLLRGIINDWPDREALAILRRCAEAAAARAAEAAGAAGPATAAGADCRRVVILKGVMPDDAPRDLSIEMVLLGGKQRTVSQMRELARQAGLEVLAAEEQPSGYFVTECILAD